MGKLLIVLLLVGCGGPIASVCLVPGLAVVTSERGDTLCSAVATNTARALVVLAEFATPAEMTQLQSVELHMTAGHNVAPAIGGITVGEHVTVSAGMGALAHELFHVLDWYRGDVRSALHPGWDTNGRDAASEQYKNNRVSPVP